MKRLFLCGILMALSVGIFVGCDNAKNVAERPAQNMVKEEIVTTKATNKEVTTSEIPSLDFERVKNDFSEFGSTNNLEEMEFHNSLNNVIYTEIESISKESYYQEIEFLYDLFSRTVKITINYSWNGNEWEPGIIYDEEYTLSDNINGRWVNYLKAGHPMHIDSSITVDIEKIGDSTCDYSFVRTSRIAGGNDESFSGTKEIDAIHDGIGGPLIFITIAYDGASGDYINITPEGLVYAPGVSTEEYILSKE